MAADLNVTKRKLVLFELRGETYALDIIQVNEIIRPLPITRVPKAAPSVAGLINLRGRVIPVVDMHKRFGLGNRHKSDRARIIIVSQQDEIIGAWVDAVIGVKDVAAEAFEAGSQVIHSVSADYISDIASVEESEDKKTSTVTNIFQQLSALDVTQQTAQAKEKREKERTKTSLVAVLRSEKVFQLSTEGAAQQGLDSFAAAAASDEPN